MAVQTLRLRIDEFHWQDSAVHAGFVSPFSFVYSILYRTAATWLQHLLSLAVQEQKPVITEPLILNRIHSSCFRSLILWKGAADDLIMTLLTSITLTKILSTKPLL